MEKGVKAFGPYLVRGKSRRKKKGKNGMIESELVMWWERKTGIEKKT